MTQHLQQFLQTLDEEESLVLKTIFPEETSLKEFVHMLGHLEGRSQMQLVKSWQEIVQRWPRPEKETDLLFWKFFCHAREDTRRILGWEDRQIFVSQMLNAALYLISGLYIDDSY